MKPAVRRAVAGLLILSTAVTATYITRMRLHTQRHTIGLAISLPAATKPHGELDATTQIALYSVGLGVLRAVAINFLWMRTNYLQRRGEYFEAASLAEGITLLQPRLPQIWAFHAHNMAYNIAAAFPAENRFRWIGRGLALLRDDGRRFNPQSHTILQEISLIFFDKVGGSVQHVDLFHDQALARQLSVPENALRVTLARWGIEGRGAQRLQATYRFPALDFRSAFVHSAYWASRAIELEEKKGLRLRKSRELLFESVRMLLNHGRIVRDGFKKQRAFASLPNLDYLPTLEHLVETDGNPDNLVALAEAAFYLYAHGRRTEAKAQLARLTRAGLESPELDDFVTRFVVAYMEDTAEPTPAELRGVLVTLIESAQCTLLAEKVDGRSLAFSRGLLDVARLVHRAWNPDGSRQGASASKPTFDDCVAAVFRARRTTYSEARRPKLSATFTERFAQVYPRATRPPDRTGDEEAVKLPEFLRPVALPWRLALLDPFWEARR